MNRQTVITKISSLAAELAEDEPNVSAALLDVATNYAKAKRPAPAEPLRVSRETIRSPNIDASGNCADFGGSSRNIICMPEDGIA